MRLVKRDRELFDKGANWNNLVAQLQFIYYVQYEIIGHAVSTSNSSLEITNEAVHCFCVFGGYIQCGQYNGFELRMEIG